MIIHVHVGFHPQTQSLKYITCLHNTCLLLDVDSRKSTNSKKKNYFVKYWKRICVNGHIMIIRVHVGFHPQTQSLNYITCLHNWLLEWKGFKNSLQDLANRRRHSFMLANNAWKSHRRLGYRLSKIPTTYTFFCCCLTNIYKGSKGFLLHFVQNVEPSQKHKTIWVIKISRYHRLNSMTKWSRRNCTPVLGFELVKNSSHREVKSTITLGIYTVIVTHAYSRHNVKFVLQCHCYLMYQNGAQFFGTTDMANSLLQNTKTWVWRQSLRQLVFKNSFPGCGRWSTLSPLLIKVERWRKTSSNISVTNFNHKLAGNFWDKLYI